MTQRIALLASHEIAEYDDIRMFTDLGFDVFCPGGYQNPREHEGLRPALPHAPLHPDLIDACERVRREHGDPGLLIDAAKAHLPDEVIEWADVIIVHHFPERWLAPQWGRIDHKRVIWRTCGQSNPDLEAYMAQGRAMGMQIVRYSPKERNLPHYAGADALIRFGKYPSDYGPWIGDEAAVGNVTQNMLERADATGLSFWLEATRGLPTSPAGPGSEQMGGRGALSHDDMREYLRHLRVYLYTGTVPAPYTLGLIEAMLTGVPVVSIGPGAWDGSSDLFEGHELVNHGQGMAFNDPYEASLALLELLQDGQIAAAVSKDQRRAAIDLFDVATVGQQWQEFLS